MMMKPILLFALLACACAPNPDDVGLDFKTTPGTVEDWRDEVIYQLLTDRFGNGSRANDGTIEPGELGRYQGGDWQGVIDHLDYLDALGVTAIWISPVVRNLESDSGFDGYHGYWQQDMTRPNQHFGGIADLQQMVQAAHAHGIKVILDLVANHMGQLFYYDINGNGEPDVSTYGSGCGVQPPANTQPCPNGAIITSINEYDPDYDPDGVQGYSSLGFSGPAPVRWIYDPDIDRLPPLPGSGASADQTSAGAQLFQRLDWYHRKGGIINYGIQEEVITGDFPGGLKDIATERTDVQAAMTAVFARWIRMADFDGFRIDTLKHVDHEFWEAFAPGIRKYVAGQPLPDPTQLGVAEATVPPLTVPKTNFFMFGESFDGDDVLNGSFTVPNEMDSVFHFAQKFSVFDAVFKNGGPTQAIEDQITRVKADYGSQPQPGGIPTAPQDSLVNFMDNHDVARFLFDKPSPVALRNAISFLLTEQGVPCIYYGTEQEFAGGNDPTNREVLWDSGYDTTGTTFQFIRHMIDIRKAYAPLRRGDMTVRWSTTRVATEQDAGIFAFEREYQGHTVLVVVNTSDLHTSQTSASTLGGMPMMTAFPAGTHLTDVLSGDAANGTTTDAGGTLSVTLPPRTTRIFVPDADVVQM